MKHSVSLILFPQKGKNGSMPIYIRITISGKTSYISTGYNISEKSWDGKNERVKNHSLANEINADITQRKQAIVRAIVDGNLRGKKYSAKEVKDRFSTTRNLNNIFEFAESYITDVRDKIRPSTAESYRKHLRKLEAFNGSKNLSFEDMTPEYLIRFYTYLSENGVNHRKGGTNYASAIWKTLKRLFNVARKRKLISEYPFDLMDNPGYKDDDKEHLTLEELNKWEGFAYSTTDPIYKQAATWFLFGCYSGLRISDWYKFDLKKNVQDGFIMLRAWKNERWISMPISKRLQKVFDNYIPLTTKEPVINRSLKDIAEIIGIEKKLSSHCARKTFAVTMCLGHGIQSDVACELMGITLQTFIRAYRKITPDNIRNEVIRAWG